MESPAAPGPRDIVLYVGGREGFFKRPACINCPVEEFCACEGADLLFDIDGVMKRKLVDVGEGVRMSEPVKVEKGLIGGCYASLSHQGILAICTYDGRHILQFTDLNTGKQVEMEVEGDTLVGFYNDKALLLTLDEPLREATVERAFDEPDIATFEEIEGTSDVNPRADVSLLNERRALYYPTIYYKLWMFNVDTRTNTRIDIGKKIWRIASSTGIDCGVKFVFYYNEFTYTLNWDNTITKVGGKQEYILFTVFPSTTNPNNIKDAVFKHGYYLVKGETTIDTKSLIGFNAIYSVVRVYKDIFLAYDANTKSWVLIRIMVC